MRPFLSMEQWREKLRVDDVLRRSREILALERQAEMCAERREEKLRELDEFINACRTAESSR